ncbi:hypothetical protein GMSM_30980 [Geomonas sp. Red276]
MTEEETVRDARTGASLPATFPIRGAKRWRLVFTAAKGVLLVALLLSTVFIVTVPASSSAAVSVGISVTFAPPALPVYVQPPPPAPDYIWVPGYWAWDPEYGYYWVPGTWVPAPYPGWLWTPGYWAWDNGVYFWNEGYWGPVVGYYGGINYGCGYNGYGYYGGYWRDRHFYYNRAVNNVGSNVTTVYRSPVNRSTTRRVSFSGGERGVHVRPTTAQLAATRERGSGPIAPQREHTQAARRDPGLRASANRGRPGIAATVRPGALSGPGVVPAKRAGAPYRAPAAHQTGGREKVPGGASPERARHEPAPAGVQRGGHEQPAHQQAAPRRERPGATTYRPPAEPRREERTPREFAPPPVQRREQPAVREIRPPAGYSPAREMPRMAPPSMGGHAEPRGAPHEAPPAPHGGGAPREEGGHGR